MDSTGKQLLKLLFNEGETVCVTHNKYSYHSVPLAAALDGRLMLVSKESEKEDDASIKYTPLRYTHSQRLILVAINPINGFKQDCDVTAFRSFLWEIDVGPIPQQLDYFKTLKVPISAQVFSGSKSVHSITVLDEDIKDEKTWRYLNEWGLNILTCCDQRCKNPSRACRVPGSYREPTKKQRLISIGQRVKTADFIAWLRQYEHLRPEVSQKRHASNSVGTPERLSGWAKKQLKEGIVFKNGRNGTWYALAMDFALAGYTEEQAIQILGERYEEEHDFKEKEWLTTIGSAFKKSRDLKD